MNSDEQLNLWKRLLLNASAWLTSQPKAPQVTNPARGATAVPPATQTVFPAPKPNPTALQSPWNDPVIAHHNVRVICDQEGLTYDQKEILTACVYQESGFKISAVNHGNSNGTSDFGIVQVNTVHIGPGREFLSPDYILSHPEECVRWMARYYKAHGHLRAWASYSTGAYKRWLGKV